MVLGPFDDPSELKEHIAHLLDLRDELTPVAVELDRISDRIAALRISLGIQLDALNVPLSHFPHLVQRVQRERLTVTTAAAQNPEPAPTILPMAQKKAHGVFGRLGLVSAIYMINS